MFSPEQLAEAEMGIHHLEAHEDDQHHGMEMPLAHEELDVSHMTPRAAAVAEQEEHEEPHHLPNMTNFIVTAGALPLVVPKPRKKTGHAKMYATRRNWLRVDGNGTATLVQADKSKLIQKLGVQARDLRIMDPSFATTYPSALLCRDRALVVNLEHIKVIITTSHVLVTNADDDATLPFITELKNKLPQVNGMAGTGAFPAALEPPLKPSPSPLPPLRPGIKGSSTSLPELAGAVRSLSMDLPFELRALEICLESVCMHFHRLASDLEAAAYPALDGLTASVSMSNLERVRRVKGRLVRLTTRVETIRELLEKLLDDDKDMHDMNLTAKEASETFDDHNNGHEPSAAQMLPQERTLFRKSRTPRARRATGSNSSSSSSHSSDSSVVEAETAEVEMLLEAYFMHMDNSYNRLQTLNEYIQDTEDLVNLKLDQHRNQLIGIDLMLTALTVVAALITTVSGIFGMNLDSELQMVPNLFNIVAIVSSGGAMILFVGFIAFLYWRQLLIW